MVMSAQQQREKFVEFLKQKRKSNGEPYSHATINSYASSLSSAPRKLDGIELEFMNLFEVTSVEMYREMKARIKGAPNYDEVNQRAGNRAFQYALDIYEDLLLEQDEEGVIKPMIQKSKILERDPIMKPMNESVEVELNKNLILYGPPGTGKTYYTVAYSVAIIEEKSIEEVQQEMKDKGYESVRARYRTYKENGQIGFTTFHQSYGYEEFIEGIKPKMDTEESGDGQVSYEIKEGIFKRFCERAHTPVIQGQNNFGILEDPTIWKVSLGGAGDNELKRVCFNSSRIRIGWDGYGKDLKEDTDYSQYGGETILTRFIDEMMIGDIVLVLHDQKRIDGIGVITGDYEWLENEVHYKRSRAVKWLAKDILDSIYEINGNKVMTLGSVYRLNRISLADVLQLIQKHQKTYSPAITENKKNYVFIIDEINRGNISKIFGELMTLIEPTKRLGQEEEIKLQLPYSQEPFGIPNNVYLLATMNTADRSISRLDTALRRRFHFIEMMPDPSLLSLIDVQGLDLEALLTKINKRIEVLVDRDHTIGHAYFMSLKANPTLDQLGHIFKSAIIPLLQEYFYEDYQLIRLVLGDPNKDNEEQIIQANPIPIQLLFGQAGDIELEDSLEYSINEKAFSKIEAFRKIYSV